MKQLTLVALYGDKAPALRSLIASCQGIASRALRRAFTPYDIKQIHATIIGLEHSEAGFPQNANFRHLRGQCVEMDILGFLGDLRVCSDLPLSVQVGGFTDQDRTFVSRNKPPHLRTFSVQGEKAVLIGWPCRTDSRGIPRSYPPTLDTIRRRAKRFGILHSYHRSDTDLDNDFFFRIGLVDRDAVSDAAVTTLEQRVRRYLSGHAPLLLPVGMDDLRVAAYRDERLPVDSTEVRSVSDPDSDGEVVFVGQAKSRI